MNPDHTSWTTRDGKQMPFKAWPAPRGKARAVLVCIHGLSGAASDFWPVGESLPASAIAVYGLQLRGQGNDPDKKKRGDIRSSMEWRHDLLDFTRLISERHPGAPVFWFGESLGALITVDTAASLPATQKCVAGIILASPVVGLRENLRLSFFKNLAVRSLLRLWPGKRISLEAMGNSEVRVTSATTHREQMQHTEHYVEAFTLRLFGQVERLILAASRNAAEIRVPALVFYTPNDALTPHEAVESFCEHLATKDKTRVFFPESYHLILHDRDREAAVRKIREWLENHAR